ncbi:hypothetical protein HK104_007661 [Borealophlyctis nickersoniae]|nr:hypothetical protein HK104_007661 [Borealophlyctis nickersoniae]
MDVDASSPARDAPLPDPAIQKQILDLLILYFCNSEINGTVANVPKTMFTEPDWQEGWIPAAALSTFKRISTLTRTPSHLVHIALAYAPHIFQSSPCGTKLRRISPYEARDAAIASAQNAVAKNVVEAVGFAGNVTAVEVATFFKTFGALRGVEKGNNLGESVWWVEFEDPAVMVKVLAAKSHEYEDGKIVVCGRSKPNAAQIPSSSTSRLESRSKIHNFARGRVLRFKIPDPDTPPSVPALRAAFEAFSPVTSLDLDKGAVVGHVRFKKGVAKDVITVASRMDGIVVGGDKLDCCPLEDEEERLYWEVTQERERNAPPPPSQSHIHRRANLLKKQKKPQQKRANAKQHRQNVISGGGSEETQLNAHGKRVKANDDDGPEKVPGSDVRTAAKEGRKVKAVKRGRVELGNNKRVKVDPLEAMFLGLKVGLGEQEPQNKEGTV